MYCGYNFIQALIYTKAVQLGALYMIQSLHMLNMSMRCIQNLVIVQQVQINIACFRFIFFELQVTLLKSQILM